MKTCPICNLDLAPADFHRRKKSPDGRDKNCKRCANKIRVARDHKNHGTLPADLARATKLQAKKRWGAGREY